MTRRRTRRRVVLSAVAGAALLAVVLTLTDALGITSAPPDPAAAALVDKQAPPLRGPSIGADGGNLDLASLRGHVVLVTVWATWCTPCRDELPLLASTRQQLAPQGLAVLGVLTRDQPASGRKLIEALHAGPFPSVDDPDGSLAVSWGVTGVPETFVVDRTGRIRARCFGALTQAFVHRYVEPLVTA